MVANVHGGVEWDQYDRSPYSQNGCVGSLWVWGIATSERDMVPQLRLPTVDGMRLREESIALQELLPIVMACAMWGDGSGQTHNASCWHVPCGDGSGGTHNASCIATTGGWLSW